jgi:hypothetical protein
MIVDKGNECRYQNRLCKFRRQGRVGAQTIEKKGESPFDSLRSFRTTILTGQSIGWVV